MAKQNAPFKFDIVGSFLRPEELKKARADYTAGVITAEQLNEVENKCITELVAKQKKAGLPVITDGEFRRSYWHLDFMWGFHGIEHIELDHGYFFHGEETTHGSIKVTGKISGENHPFIEHYKFVKQFEDENTVARQTIPAPAQLLAELFREDNGKDTLAVYADQEELIQDIAKAYRTVMQELYAAGCRNVQFDDCTWGMFCDAKYWEARQKEENVSVEEEAEKYLRLNNLAIEGKPEELVINTHVCRGNYHSTWASSGGYAPIAPYLFVKEQVDAYYLEFDDERSGDFEPLKYVSENKKVVLGLITTKSPVLEDKETIIARIHEAEKYIPLERLCLSPQCGFASCEIGNNLTDEEQWAKLALVKEISEEVWNR
ncbi:MAG: 5-methyltetrahydropteroyltriglutamate--homocysteine S-methyltransferase [Anaerostipes sp.]|jgi:5-methyltetrahydropteroyltriglutamate--homocysteine methyltransferase|nr:5-methyltetrahydropteroyltriglutamate--homocysteine S-methyltransferase [Anaerostipes sp.]